MNREQKLKLQAYLDRELSEREAHRMNDWIQDDPRAASLLTELTWIKSIMKDNDPEVKVPETRDFYWSKIRQGIERELVAPRPAGGWLSWPQWVHGWQRLVAPLSGVALGLFLVLGVVNFYNLPAYNNYPRNLAQIESPSDKVGAFSFRSQSENVFVIWLYDRHELASSSADSLNDLVFQ